jgi:hypothetical protein
MLDDFVGFIDGHHDVRIAPCAEIVERFVSSR